MEIKMRTTNPKCQAIVAVLITLIVAETVFCRLLECGDILQNVNGTITKPTPNRSISYSSCKIVIDTRNRSRSRFQHLQFHVTRFDVKGMMPRCNHGNYLEIFVGCKFASIGRFCGVRSFPVFYSTDGCMSFALHGEIQHLKAEYSLRPSDKAVQHIPSGCGTSHLANIRHGNIHSPRWPLPYPDYVDCVWTVRAHRNLRVKLIFFDLDVNVHQPCQEMDFLEVRAGNSGYTHARTVKTKTDSQCGRKEPFHVIINSDTFYITFRSDKSTGPRGFMAGFIAYEKELPAFKPNIVIVFGGAFVVFVIVSIKKFIVPCLSNRKQESTNFWCFKKTPQVAGYACGCRQDKISKQIKNYPEADEPDFPVTHSFMGPNQCWEFPNVENAFIPIQTPTETKSASDIRCLSPYGAIGKTYEERRPSCKSVRFAAAEEYPPVSCFTLNS